MIQLGVEALGGVPAGNRDGRLADPAAADGLDPGADRAAEGRPARRRVGRLDRVALELGVGDHEAGHAVAHAEQGHPGVDPGGAAADERRELALAEPAADDGGEAVELLLALLLEPLEPIGRQAGAELRDDVEVDEADRGGGDREEEQDQPVADAGEGGGTRGPPGRPAHPWASDEFSSRNR